MEDVVNAFFSKEALLFSLYLEQVKVTDNALVVQSIAEISVAGFAISKGIFSLGSRLVGAAGKVGN